jgi:hypothetical protein
MSAKWEFRLAVPSDAPAFAEWVKWNLHIDPKDVATALKENNPTVIYFVATKDGVPVAFSPIYTAAVVAHLGFDPLSEAEDRKTAMNVLHDGTMAFFVQFGIREILALSDPKYGAAKYAMKRGFEQDTRSLFRFDINKAMEKPAGELETVGDAAK